MKRKVALILPFVIVLVLALPFVVFAQDPWWYDFDDLDQGVNMCGTDGWSCWDDNPAAAAYTTDDEAFSTPNSVEIVGESDLVYAFSGYTSGVWTLSTMQYVPANLVGQAYFIMLNEYAPLGTQNWSLQILFDAAAGLVLDDGAIGNTLPIIVDEWVPLEVVIDLDNNLQTVYYGGDELFTDSWTEHVSGGGSLNIGAIDLWGNFTESPVYYDDFHLEEVLPLAPGIAVDKSPDFQDIVAGGNADFTITITNTGDLSLTVDAVDPMVAACDNAVGELGPGEVFSYGCTDVGVAASYTNTVYVTGTVVMLPQELGDGEVTDSDDAYVMVHPPTAVSLSSFGGEGTAANAFTWLAITAVAFVGVGLIFAVSRRRASKI